MRILHTADWHLGKTLENHLRIEEQALFIEDICVLAEEKDIDLVLIAGDIYDSINPPAAAEKLFYYAMKRLSKNGQRPLIVIAGNHDNPERLMAASPLATENGIILLGTPKSIAEAGDYDFYTIVDAGEGYVELNIRGETVVAITLPYPSEKRLNEVFFNQSDAEEASLQKSYSQKVEALLKNLSLKYRRDTINICVGHFYVNGGQSSNSERDIQIGGIFAVDAAALPKTAQYIALGHLHRPQQAGANAYYSGSPLQYSVSETGYAKCVYVTEILPGQHCQPEKIYLPNYKPIEIWKANSIEEAISYCEAHKDDNCWAFLHIKTDRPLVQSEIRQLKLMKKDLIEIKPLMPEQDAIEQAEYTERSLLSEFKEYYQEVRGVEPGEELLKLLLSLSGEEAMDETD